MIKLIARLRLPLLLCWLSMASLSSYGDESNNFEALFTAQANKEQLGQLAQRLNMGDSAQGRFTQYRYLSVLNKPLISQGEFIFKEELGLAWLQHTPFESALILTQGTLIQIDSDGNQQVTQAGDNRQANSLAQMMPTLMSALLRGDIDPLATQFSLHLLQDEQGWQLGLIPLDPLLAKAIEAIVLQGNQGIDALTLLNPNGDRSQIQFTQLSNAPLTDEQLGYFAGVADTAPLSTP
jgi:hypothetical protein